VVRWLVIEPGPGFSVFDVHTGICAALRSLGEQVAEYNLSDRISFFGYAHLPDGNGGYRPALTSRDQVMNMAMEPIRSWSADVVLAVSAFFTPGECLDMFRARGSTVVLWHTESPYQDEEQLQRAAHADLNIVNDPVSLPAFTELGPAYYQPHCYRPDVHYPGAGQRRYDFAFVGTGFASRIRFFEQMRLPARSVLAGPWPGLAPSSPLAPLLLDESMADGYDPNLMTCLDNEETAALYRESKTGINFYRREAHSGHANGVAMGPREVEMAASGLWFARDPRPEGDTLFPMLPRFTTPEEASDQVAWAVAHDEAREKAAAAAMAAVRDRTFESAARRMTGEVARIRGN